MDSDLTKEIKRVRNLVQNRGKPDAYVEKQAKTNLKIREFKANPLFPIITKENGDQDNSDQHLAEQRFKTYVNNYELSSMSDLDTLRSLIFNEIFETKLQREINKCLSEDKYPSDRLTSQLTSIQNQKLAIKKKLGIDKEEDKIDELTGLQTLDKRFEKYINEHKHEFTTACKKCGTLLLLRKRVKDFDCLEHPWFAGRWLFNYEILKDVKENKLSKEDAWRYMCCASQGGKYKPAYSKEYCVDYINHVLKKWKEIEEHFLKHRINSTGE